MVSVLRKSIVLALFIFEISIEEDSFVSFLHGRLSSLMVDNGLVLVLHRDLESIDMLCVEIV